MKRLAAALEKNPNLQVLDLNDNNMGSSEVAAALTTAIGSLRKLRVLNFGDCLLTAKSTSKIIQALSTHTELEELNLNFSEINDAMCDQLIEAVVKKSPKLSLLEVRPFTPSLFPFSWN